jgi:protein SCO1/2
MLLSCTEGPRACALVSTFTALIIAAPLHASEPIDLDRALRTSQAVIGKPVGDYALTDSDGRRVQLADYRGKPLVVDFVYTGCTQVCPTTTRFLARALREAQSAVGAEAFNAVTIGFNLPFDDPQAMRTFARKNDATLAHWAFLSPDAADLAALTSDFGFVYAATAGGFDHLSQVTIVGPDGRVYRQIYGESFALPMLIAPLKELVTGAPAPAPSLAALIERVRVLCTVYDPLSGRYRLDYGLFVEIFAGLSILVAIGYYLTHEWLRQRRAA